MAYNTLPTIKIKADTPKGFRIINASAFDPKVHAMWRASEPARSEPARSEPAPAPQAAPQRPVVVDPMAAKKRRGRPPKNVYIGSPSPSPAAIAPAHDGGFRRSDLEA
jgi:hypothetical protein